MRWLFGDVIDAINGLAMSCRRPVVWVRFKRKEPDMALVYAVTAGAPVDADVVSRELTAVVNGEVLFTQSLDGKATSLGEVKVPQDSSVTLTLVDIDDAGNRSQPAVVEFVATDTIAPVQPGAFGVTVLREEE